MISTENILLLLTGLQVTVGAWTGALACSLILGTIFGLLGSKPLSIPIISPAISVITMLLRGIPFYVQLLIAYFVVPDVLGLTNINALLVATGALGLCSAAYVSQAVISGIAGIGKDQWELAFVVGYSHLQAIRYIIMPQLIRSILPALCAEADQLLKSTALFCSIGIMELTGMARNIIARELNPVTVYLSIAGIYLTLSIAINGITHYIRTRMEAGR